MSSSGSYVVISHLVTIPDSSNLPGRGVSSRSCPLQAQDSQKHERLSLPAIRQPETRHFPLIRPTPLPLPPLPPLALLPRSTRTALTALPPRPSRARRVPKDVEALEEGRERDPKALVRDRLLLLLLFVLWSREPRGREGGEDVGREGVGLKVRVCCGPKRGGEPVRS